jgi:hypothetical protein
VQGLDADPLIQRLDPQLPEQRRAALRPHPLDRRPDVFVGQPLGHEDHHRPTPSVLVASDRERGHVIRPPERLERHHDVVAIELALAQELQGVRNEVQGRQRIRIGLCGIGVSGAVDRQVSHRRNGHGLEPAAGRGVGRDLLLQVDLHRARRITTRA